MSIKVDLVLVDVLNILESEFYVKGSLLHTSILKYSMSFGGDWFYISIISPLYP